MVFLGNCWLQPVTERDGRQRGPGGSRFRPGRSPMWAVSPTRSGGLSPRCSLSFPASQVTSASPLAPVGSHVLPTRARPWAGRGSRSCRGGGSGDVSRTTATCWGLRQTSQDLGQGAQEWWVHAGIAYHVLSPPSGAAVLVPNACDPTVALGLRSAARGTCPVGGEVKSEPRLAGPRAWPL